MRCSIKTITFTLFVAAGIIYCISSTWLIQKRSEELVGRQINPQGRFSYEIPSKGIDENQWDGWNNSIFPNDRIFSGAFSTTFDIASSMKICNETTPIALCIFSRPDNFPRRNAIRATWANSSLMAMDNVTLWFILGTSAKIVDNDTAEEARKYQDLIIGNFFDNSDNDTIKFIFSLHIVVTQCSMAKDIFFGYDNTYVNARHLLRKRKRQEGMDIGTWRGFKQQKISSRIRNRFRMSGEKYPHEAYFPFCSLHEGFMISASLGKDIIFSARNSTIYRSPDIFLGTIARKIGMKVVHDDSFGSEQTRTDWRKSCNVRRNMATFTYSGTHEYLWKELVNTKKLLECRVPDADVVCGPTVDNLPYFKQVLTYVSNNATICAVNDRQTISPFVLALISSHAEHFKQREAIRITWASQNRFYGRTVRFVFILGRPSGKSAEKLQDLVKKESLKYGDIVQGNFLESFRNLTFKVALGLKWAAEFCPDAGYLYKGDDDMFVSWRRLILSLLEGSDRSGVELIPRLYMGHTMRGSPREKRTWSRYYVNESVYRGKFYPLYCSGGSYLLSMDIVPELYQKACTTDLIPIDDAYQGILAGLIGVDPVNHNGFRVSTRPKYRVCYLTDDGTLSVHKFPTPASMINAWMIYRGKAWPNLPCA